MTSERKIAAARANGAKSRGPKTDAGKRRSSQNSRKHGLYARTPPDTSDIPEELAQSFASYWTIFQPKTPRAVAALEASIEAGLQIFRLQRTETAMMNAECIRLRALYPGLDRNTLYSLASGCIPTRLFQRRFTRYCRQMDRADQILFREIGLLKQRTKAAPPAMPEKKEEMSERTNQIPDLKVITHWSSRCDRRFRLSRASNARLQNPLLNERTNASNNVGQAFPPARASNARLINHHAP